MELQLQFDNDTIQKERQTWNRTCLAAGIPAINEDTCARILAVLYVHGNNEAFVLNGKFVADMEYIQNRFGIYGTGVPDAGFVRELQKYIDELEEYESAHRKSVETSYKEAKPKWAKDLFMKMYKIEI